MNEKKILTFKGPDTIGKFIVVSALKSLKLPLVGHYKLLSTVYNYGKLMTK